MLYLVSPTPNCTYFYDNIYLSSVSHHLCMASTLEKGWTRDLWGYTSDEDCSIDGSDGSDEGSDGEIGAWKGDENDDGLSTGAISEEEDSEMSGSGCPEPSVDPLVRKICYVLAALATAQLSLADFLYGLSWGSPACISDPVIRGARTQLMESPLLPEILERWCTPPRTKNTKRPRAEGARECLDRFTQSRCTEILNNELCTLAPDLKSPPSSDVRLEVLTAVQLDVVSANMMSKAPTLWALLRSLTSSPKQSSNNKEKSPDKASYLYASDYNNYISYESRLS
jgi:hypothetical protein